MKILLAASELEPFTGSGEFSASVRALAEELTTRGHDVSVVLPWYRTVRENGAAKAKKTGAKFHVPVGGSRLPCIVREMHTATGTQVFFIEREEYFDRSGLYGGEEGDYQDNAARFIFFSKCVVELARRMDPAPDVLHAHNWQAALVPVFAAEQRLPQRTVLTAHTLAYQGNFWSYDFGLTNLPADWFSPRGLEYYGSMNLLKAGIMFAHSVVLPGPRYVSEAQTRTYGCGLDPVLREQARKLEGIANGADVSTWDPATDKALPKRYKNASGKSAARKPWLSKAGLTAPGMQFLVVADAMTGDGLSTLLPAADRILESGAGLAFLGRIEPANLAGMEFLRRRHAGRFTWLPDADEETLRLALGGSDALLCPAPVSPDARIFQRALRYGTLPVSLACGGLHALAPAWNEARGFAFSYFSNTPDGLVDAVRHAQLVYRNTQAWNAAVDRAMSADFSWAATAAAMEALYASLLGRGRIARAA